MVMSLGKKPVLVELVFLLMASNIQAHGHHASGIP
jgi:hypothetical protein